MGAYVYDKAKYHDDSIEELGLPEQHAAHHTLFFLRWLIEHNLMSSSFMSESGDAFLAGKTSIQAAYEWWDRCLADDMLVDEGNAFAKAYFDFETGKYIQDYEETLAGDLPSIFHIEYTEENYQRVNQVIDVRYAEWKKSASSSAEPLQ